MAPRTACQLPEQGDCQAEASWAVAEEGSSPLRPPETQKLPWARRDGQPELEDGSTEEGGSDDEDRSEDASPVALPVFTTEETLLIFDWDDTVLPSSWLRQQGYSLQGPPICNREHLETLQTLAAVASQVLRVARQLGRVVIVTNAETGWVQLSCGRFVPSLASSLDGVDIISARSTYESPAVRSPVEWKQLAFADQVRGYYGRPGDGGRFWNVVALGDALHEKRALYSATSGVVTCHAKFVKFAERPAAEELIAEHLDVCRCLGRIVDYDGDLDVRTPGLELLPGLGELGASFGA